MLAGLLGMLSPRKKRGAAGGGWTPPGQTWDGGVTWAGGILWR